MIAVEELSQKELLVLQLLADGKTLRGTAKSMKRAEITLKHYTEIIREKLDAPTTTNAIAIALRRGLID
jgi:DNA-binding NarL/FixJ family response regulator